MITITDLQLALEDAFRSAERPDVRDALRAATVLPADEVDEALVAALRKVLATD